MHRRCTSINCSSRSDQIGFHAITAQVSETFSTTARRTHTATAAACPTPSKSESRKFPFPAPGNAERMGIERGSTSACVRACVRA